MDTKKTDKKINFLKLSKEEQEKILKEALAKGQDEQRKLERQYNELLRQGAAF